MGRRGPIATVAALVVLVGSGGLVAAASSGGDDPAPRAGSSLVRRTTSTSTTTTLPAPTVAPTTTTTAPPPPPVPEALAPILEGEAPRAASDPVALSQQIVESEWVIRDPASTPELLQAAGRLSQVVYRQLGQHPEWEPDVFANTPEVLHEAIWRQASARREFRAMHTRLGQNLPAWRIVDPVPADELLALYQEAEASFGVPWYVLASVNLVETGMGRIIGLSSAGAQGPMQFMPETWARYGLGGDAWNTRDAIMGAANYLAANGGNQGTEDGLRNALFHYNRDTRYVQGVLHYAEIMRVEPRAFLGFHAWQIVYLTAHGDVILPTGYEQAEPVPVLDWLAANPQ